MGAVTIVGKLSEAWADLESAQRYAESPEAKGEFALAKTAVEDAIMRTNSGHARIRGVFEFADVEAL